MSLILDALKKVDRERSAHRLPTLASARPPTPAPRSHSLLPARPWPRWIWVAGGALVVNTAMLLIGVWLLASFSTPETPRPSVPDAVSAPFLGPAASSSPAAAASAAPTAASAAPTAAPAFDAPEPGGATTPVAAPVPAPPPGASGTTTSRPPTGRSSAPAGPAPSGPAQAKSSPGPLAGDLALEVVVYADAPEERSAWINGRRFVEGQQLPSGLVIETIRRDSVVLRGEGRQTVLLQQQSQ